MEAIATVLASKNFGSKLEIVATRIMVKTQFNLVARF
jgi:hypothetical protein